MPEKHFMPRRLHLPIPLVWSLTGPQVFVIIVSFGLCSVFILTAKSAASVVASLVLTGAVLGGEYLFFQLMQGTRRSLVKHYLSRLKYNMKVPERYCGKE
jgi:hypothetical protein